MLKTTISSVSLAALLLMSAPVFAEEAPKTTPTMNAPAPSGGNVAVCMKKATETKKASMKAAEAAFKTAHDALKEGEKDKEKLKAVQEVFKKAQRAAQDTFEKDRKACTAIAPAKEMEKKEMKEEGEKKGEELKGLEKLLMEFKEKLKALEEKIKALEMTLLPKSATVALSAQNNSGESGTAMLKEENGKVKVTLNLTGASAGVAQPAHVHMGSCATLGGAKYPLTFLTNGKSETTLDVKWDDLKAALPLAINVHKSDAEASVYVACGDLKL